MYLARNYYGNNTRSSVINMDEIARDINNLANYSNPDQYEMQQRILFVENFMNQENNNLYNSDSSISDLDSSDLDTTTFNYSVSTFEMTPNSSEDTEEEENNEENIKKLISKYCVEKKIENIEYNNTCSVCQDIIKYKDKILILPCNHIFHKDCIKEWFKKKLDCPSCREQINKKKTLIEKIKNCNDNLDDIYKIIIFDKKLINKRNKLLNKIKSDKKNYKRNEKKKDNNNKKIEKKKVDNNLILKWGKNINTLK